MELRGFEPLAFSMPLRRAPNCATAPQNDTIIHKRGIECKLNVVRLSVQHNTRVSSGGSVWESNPPRTGATRPPRGFEDREDHQAPSAPTAQSNAFIPRRRAP